jgi:hypothetical protein
MHRIKSIIIIIFWFWATNLLVSELDLPLNIHIGSGDNIHFSLFNYFVDFLVWGLVLELVYKLCKPIFKINKTKLLLILVSLTLFLTASTLLFESPFNKPWLANEMWWLKKSQDISSVATKIASKIRGWPYDYYHQSNGFNDNLQKVWDYKVLEINHLEFDLLFWLITSMIILRLSNKFINKPTTLTDAT